MGADFRYLILKTPLQTILHSSGRLSFIIRISNLKCEDIRLRIMVHAYNPRYSGGRYHGDHGWRTAQAKS
jgi:hypothetical protein